MTQDELDALPETGVWGAREEVRDGKTVRVPVLDDVGPLWHGDGDDAIISVTDLDGQNWLIGWAADGKRYKRRCS